MRGCLIRQRIRPDAPRQHFRKHLRRVARQSDGHCRSVPDRVFDHGHRVVQGFGPSVEVTRLQPLVDTVRLAFDGQQRSARHRRRKRLRPTHAAKPGRQYPLPVQIAGVMPAAHLNKRFVSALHNPLAADVDPRSGRHLPEHHQTGPVEFTKVFPVRPRRHQVRIGDQHPGRVLVRLEHADRLAGLHQEGLVFPERLELLDDRVETRPVSSRLADPAVHDQFVRTLAHPGVEIVHDQAQRRFREPAPGP